MPPLGPRRATATPRRPAHPFHAALTHVFDSQPPEVQRKLVQQAAKRPLSAESQTILHHAATSPVFGSIAKQGAAMAHGGRQVQQAQRKARKQEQRAQAKVPNQSVPEVRTVPRYSPTSDAPKKEKSGGSLLATFMNRSALSTVDPTGVVRHLPVIGKVARNAAKDLVDIPANAIPSTYYLGKTAIHDPGKAVKMLAEPYIHAAEHPVHDFVAHPVGTGLLFSGMEGALGRTAGGIMRAAPAESSLARFASAERPSATLPGTSLAETRRFSNDVIIKRGQVAADRVNKARVQRLHGQAAKALRAGDDEKALRLTNQAHQLDRTRLSDKQVRKRMDEEVDVNEQTRRMHRAAKTNEVDALSKGHRTPALSLVSQAITKPMHEDLLAYHDELAHEYGSLKRESLKRANRELRQQIQAAMRDPKALEGMQEAATRYEQLTGALQQKLVDADMLHPEQAAMAKLIPYAVRRMGAKMEGDRIVGAPSVADVPPQVIHPADLPHFLSGTSYTKIIKHGSKDAEALKRQGFDFEKTQRSTFGHGVYATADSAVARGYGEPVDVAVRFKKPLIVGARGSRRNERWGKLWDQASSETRRQHPNVELGSKAFQKAKQRVFTDMLRQAGYDGLVIKGAQHDEHLVLDPNAVRVISRNAPRMTTLPGQNQPLSAAQIRAHMRETGTPMPAYVTQAPKGGSGYFVAQHEAPSPVGRVMRTGEATRVGAFDASPETLRENVARMQGLVDAHEGFSRLVNHFGLRDRAGTVRTVASRKDAAELAREMSARGHGSWRPIRVQPFAGRSGQLHDLLEQTRNEDMPEHTDIRDAIEAAIGHNAEGPGRWTVVPEAAADQLGQHIRVLGSGGPGKLGQLFNTQFRKVVLSLSPKWLAGNTIEAGLRSGINRAGPRSWYVGKRIVRTLADEPPRTTALSRTAGAAGDMLLGRYLGRDPQAAEELTARAMGGGHYAMSDRVPRRGAQQFDRTSLEKTAQRMSKFWDTPGPKQAAAGWHAYTHFVFETVNKRIESQFQTAMAGAHVRRTLMPRTVLKTSQRAIDQAAEGLRNTQAQVDLARAVDRAYGRYSKFSPAMRRALVLYTPFVAWTFNAFEFLTGVLPRDHPALASLIASASQASEQWRKDHGLTSFEKGRVPDFLQGSIPLSGDSKLRVSRYTPFSLAGDPLGTAAGAILPQASSMIAAAKGSDWTGRPLKDPTGSPTQITKGKAVATAFLEESIPLLSQAQSYSNAAGTPVQKLRHVFDPFAATKPKAKKSRGGGRKASTGVVFGGGGSGGPPVTFGGGGSSGSGVTFGGG